MACHPYTFFTFSMLLMFFKIYFISRKIAIEHTSVGLAHARPNKYILQPTLHTSTSSYKISHQFILLAVIKLKATTSGTRSSGSPNSSLVFAILFISQKPVCSSDFKMTSVVRGKSKNL